LRSTASIQQVVSAVVLKFSLQTRWDSYTLKQRYYYKAISFIFPTHTYQIPIIPFFISRSKTRNGWELIIKILPPVPVSFIHQHIKNQLQQLVTIYIESGAPLTTQKSWTTEDNIFIYLLYSSTSRLPDVLCSLYSSFCPMIVSTKFLNAILCFSARYLLLIGIPIYHIFLSATSDRFCYATGKIILIIAIVGIYYI